jgi:Cu/Zn superoxide dismutase
VRFYDRGEKTKVSVRIEVPRGVTALQDFHGFHVHANDNPANGQGCEADPAAPPSSWFVSADGHLEAPGETHGGHKGDLQTLYLLANGEATATFYVDRFEVHELAGRAVILHANRDNYGNVPLGTAPEEYTANSPAAVTRTADTGNAGGRVACGVVEVGSRTGEPSTRPPDGDIWVIDVSTGVTRPLVSTPRLEGAPDWSPEGRRLAFGRLEAEVESGNTDIWVTDFSGGEPLRLVGGPARDLTPDWSPDGRRIAFSSDRRDSEDIWFVDVADGTLTQMTDHPARDQYPRFSPDGRHLVFVSDRAGSPDVWITEVDGGPPRQLTFAPDVEIYPAFSPDGRSLAYLSQGPGRPPELWLIGVDGRAPRRLLGIESPNRLAWSPDGTHLAVREEVDRKLHLLNVETGEVTPLTRGDGDHFYPTWSPDGGQLAYAVIGSG